MFGTMRSYLIGYRLKQSGKWQYEKKILGANGIRAAEDVLISSLLNAGVEAEEFEVKLIFDVTDVINEKITLMSGKPVFI